MVFKVPEYTVYIPKWESIKKCNIDDIGKFIVNLEDHNLILEQVPSFNAWYTLIHNDEWWFPLQNSDKLNILKIPWGKDYSVWLAHLLGRWHHHKNSPRIQLYENLLSSSEQKIVAILWDSYRPELIRELQLISHDKKFKKPLINILQLRDSKISDWLRKILSLPEPSLWKWLTWWDTKDLYIELFRSSHSAWDNAVRECWEETGLLMNKSQSPEPYLIINQLKTSSKWWPVMKKYAFYSYHDSVDDTWSIRPSMSEAEYKFYLKYYDSVTNASAEAFTKIEDKIKQNDWYKMPIWLINARWLQHAPK